MCCMCEGYKKHDRRKQQKGKESGEAKKTGGVWLNAFKLNDLFCQTSGFFALWREFIFYS